MRIINPATEEVIKDLIEDTEHTLQSKYKSLRSALPGWQQQPLNERIKCMVRFSELLKTNIENLSEVLTSEVGKPLQQSRNEINGAGTRIGWLTANAEKYLSDEVMNADETITERISYEPLGVVCNISAWNYPYLVGINVFVPALIAGNTVLYKPSEHSTLTGLEIQKLLYAAGVPSDAFQVAIGAKEVGEILLNMPFDGYFFTGSYKTGKHIYDRVSSKMVPCQLELGGKDPLYVCDDNTDIKSVAAATADGAFYNNGQSCCAVERIYVHENVYEKYVDEFVKEVKSYNVGKPTEEGVYIGPLCRKGQVEFLQGQVNDAVKKGGLVATGGHAVPGTGYYFQPTVILNATHSMDVVRAESFGPIIAIMKVKDDEEAVKLMQDTEYGLTAAVYSNSQHRAEEILKRMNAGTGYWNCCDRVSAALPWSGRNHSGFGATLSHVGLRAFTRPKAYHLKKQNL
jgi:acyl-CoA reductase-like NAD-dependent aldehyde dehydrogenase